MSWFRPFARAPRPQRRRPRHRLGSFDRLEERAVPAVFTVTSTADTGPPGLATPGTFRWAVEQANISHPGQLNAVQFAPALAGARINLSTIDDTTAGPSALIINNAITINGSGQTIARGPGSPAMRFFLVTGQGQLYLNFLTLAGGHAQGGKGGDGNGGFGGGGAAGLGGAVENRGYLFALDCTFMNNMAVGGTGGDYNGGNGFLGGGGGGGLNGDGTLQGGSGGGGDGGSDGQTSPTPGQDGGFGGGGGGGAYHDNPDGTVSQSLGGMGGFGGGGGGGVGYGSIGGFAGGAGFNGGGGGAALGGAVFNQGGNVLLDNCTLAGNTALAGNGIDGGQAGGAYGGGLFNLDGSAGLFACTFSVNFALPGKGYFPNHDGGTDVYNFSAGVATRTGASLYMTDDILGSYAPDGCPALGNFRWNYTATVDASAPNLVTAFSTDGGATIDARGIIAGNPNLGTLRINGGLTPTMLPGAGSPALRAGTVIQGLEYDQRGALRESPPDLGAAELLNPLEPVDVPRPLFSPHPNASANEAFVKGLYHAILERDADPAGLQAAVAALNAGQVTRQQLTAQFYNSTENRRNQVITDYHDVLNRDPDPAGLNAGVAFLQSGGDEAALVVGLFTSAEFTQYNTNDEFVNALYATLMGRNPGTTEFKYWRGLLDSNTQTRTQVAQELIRSTEAVQRVVAADYRVFLQRAADPAGLAGAVQAIQGGAHFGAVAVALLSSQEFFNDAAAAVP
jgi:hypothetical protein